MVVVEPCGLGASKADRIHLLTEHRNNNLVVKAGCETWDCAWSHDCSYFAWSCGGRIVRLVPWDYRKNNVVESDDTEDEAVRPKHVIDCGELVWALAFGSSSGISHPQPGGVHFRRFEHFTKDLILATGLQTGRIRIWCVNSGQLLAELIDHKSVVRDLRFAPDGSLILASASRDGTVKLWDLNDDGNMYKTLRSNCEWIYNIAWSPDTKMLVTVGKARSAVIWDTKTFVLLRKLEGHYHDVCSADFSSDGALVVTSSYDTRAIVWDPHTGDPLFEFCHMYPTPHLIYASGANGSYVRGSSFSRDGMHLATVCDDGYLRFWNLASEEGPEQIAEVQDALCCNYSPNGSCVAVGTRDGSVSLWSAPQHVGSLQHLCRMTIRRSVRSTEVDKLFLPIRLKEFLKYKNFIT